MKRVNLTPVLELGTNKILYYIDESSNTKYYPEDKEGVTMQCPEGFIFINEKGDIIDAKRISLKRKYPQYPKPYKECCEVLGIEEDLCFVYEDIDGNHINPACISNYRIRRLDLYRNLEKLRICRDAYWKIAGEQMGLGKLWQPEWNYINREKFVIYNLRNNITKAIVYTRNEILVFPTEEMQDIFYENFKGLIETCKELL